MLDQALFTSYQLLNKVSRSFALCIQELPDSIRDHVANFYLLARYLDSIEDSSLAEQQKREGMDSFLHALKHKDEQAMIRLSRRIEEGIYQKQDRELLQKAPHVFDVYQSFDEDSQQTIFRWLSEMQRGMLKYFRKDIQTFRQLDEYCYYVAGTPGHYLTEVFCRHAALNQEFLEANTNDFGLLLQKVNIIRDLAIDYQQQRYYWPTELLQKLKIVFQNLFDPRYSEQRRMILAEMIENAKNHYEKSLNYILAIPENLKEIRLFLTIPFFMAVATLEKCKNNETIFDFKQTVKISREQTEQLYHDLKLK